MISAKEHIQRQSEVVWITSIELLKHVLQADRKQTYYKDKNPSWSHYYALSKAIDEELKKPDDCKEIMKKKYTRIRKRRKPFYSDIGELDIERFIELEPRCFQQYDKKRVFKASLTIALDIAIPYGERGTSKMAKRHKKVYERVAQCQVHRQPVRVIACSRTQIPETEKGITLFIIIKNYREPIYPAIWGALKTSTTTNDFLNVIMDYFIGTRSGGNGSPVNMYLEDYIKHSDVEILDGYRLKSRKENKYG